MSEEKGQMAHFIVPSDAHGDYIFIYKITCLAQLFFSSTLSSLFLSSVLCVLPLCRLNVFVHRSQDFEVSARAKKREVDNLYLVLFYFDAKRARAACSLSTVDLQ